MLRALQTGKRLTDRSNCTEREVALEAISAPTRKCGVLGRAGNRARVLKLPRTHRMPMNYLGRTLKLHLVDGEPSGLITAEIMNWTGHVITGPRGQLSALLQRPETKRTGVYFLLGAEQAVPDIYIGESDDIAQRLTTHNRPEGKGGKDFWEKVCIVTSKDANLTKGHIKFLESRLIQISKEAGRCHLVNTNEPEYTNLPEADRADMEYFISQIQVLLPVLGIGFLRPTPTISLAPSATITLAFPLFIGNLPKDDIKAEGREIDGEFVVLKGSTTRLKWVGQQQGHSYESLFNEMLDSGVIAPALDGKHNEFTRDYAFSSPSAAGAVVTGRPCNGRVYWIVEGTNKTYAEWQEELLNANMQMP